ncbi:E3 ubiquitin-protein ligase RAD18 isoform X2 [Hemicordylus capensis]|uniref:E3 ubiquitin-protein ligase RAD18 isoform X2 n=1 Tax=Hemicordylus capensis TaxID=884348 RepID=UPI002303F31F|nr:E3 ubiquitin-protein ligase RAD18 isoform X2 [Hemicordylus capensis]XP_053155428.1 E3 ubiquitin-protein ligase RAD18 isoform X2 [Hemicordylus capensis]
MSVALDKSRWPDHLVPLKEVDNLLRCGICFDYFNTAMIIPQCSHNYCSFCIRKSLSYKAQCPTCCMAATEPDLKNNRILDELVKTFYSARQQLLQAVLDPPPVSTPTFFTKKFPLKDRILSSPVGFALKQEKQFPDTDLVKENIHSPVRSLNPPARESKVVKTKQEENPCGSEEGHESSISSVADTTIPETPSTSAAKIVTKVECPVCGVPIREQHINQHLDDCLRRDEKKDSLRSSGHKRKFLPKVVYNLLSERDLRKRLKEHGLSTQGTKQKLIKRHQEFVHMYNSQCDSLNPKSVAEIVKELENNEKIRAQLDSSKPEEDNMMFTKHQTENEIDEIHRDYRKKHKAEFQLLIDQVNKRKKKAAKIKIEEEGLDQEETIAAELPMETGENLNVKESTDLPSLPEWSMKTDALDCGISQSLNLSEDRGLVPESPTQSSESSESSSSDIIRDLEIAGMCSGSSDKLLPVYEEVFL